MAATNRLRIGKRLYERGVDDVIRKLAPSPIMDGAEEEAVRFSFGLLDMIAASGISVSPDGESAGTHDTSTGEV